MTALTIVFGVFGVVGGICGLWSLVYVRHQTELARKQTEMMENDIKERKEQGAEDDRWAYRFEELSAKLRRISPNMQVKEPKQINVTYLYGTMYPDPKFRIDVESFIVLLDSSKSVFLPRSPQPHEFRSPKMRETIAKGEALMEQFVKEHPTCKQHLYG